MPLIKKISDFFFMQEEHDALIAYIAWFFFHQYNKLTNK